MRMALAWVVLLELLRTGAGQSGQLRLRALVPQPPLAQALSAAVGPAAAALQAQALLDARVVLVTQVVTRVAGVSFACSSVWWWCGVVVVVMVVVAWWSESLVWYGVVVAVVGVVVVVAVVIDGIATAGSYSDVPRPSHESIVPSFSSSHLCYYLFEACL